MYLLNVCKGMSKRDREVLPISFFINKGNICREKGRREGGRGRSPKGGDVILHCN